MAVMFVFTSVPGLITPFDESETANPLLADRIADDLSESTLVDSSGSAQLNESAAEAFFVDASEDEVRSILGIDDRRSFNVSITNSTTGTQLDEYAVGDPVPDETGQVTVTQRILLADGESYWLSVRVW
uniref:DUF7287 family protein n=1 Tax=Natrarchaeobius oligotrophus TaxID=3455743 RepID=UPI000F548D2E|nr:hypothetical protein [Natrarchaeobius chitinivorans]